MVRRRFSSGSALLSLAAAGGCGGSASTSQGHPDQDLSSSSAGVSLPAESVSLAPAVDCSKYRDVPGKTEVAVVVRNQRARPIYLQPINACLEPITSLVDWERNGLRVQVRGRSCWYPSCEDVQERGFQLHACPAGCLNPWLIRLDPGAEIDAGRLWDESVQYGASLHREPMPDACLPGSGAPLADAVVQCSAQIPLPDGPYRLLAHAFESLHCTRAEPCDCVPGSSGSCTTNAVEGIDTALEAEAAATLPAASVTLTFR